VVNEAVGPAVLSLRGVIHGAGGAGDNHALAPKLPEMALPLHFVDIQSIDHSDALLAFRFRTLCSIFYVYWMAAIVGALIGLGILFDVVRSKGIAVVTLSGGLTLGTSLKIADSQIQAAIEDGATKIVIDLTDVEYVDSAGLGMLNRLIKLSSLQFHPRD
jgi:ABC-type transporter Mla MlaB component